jgi:hypothetical protein
MDRGIDRETPQVPPTPERTIEPPPERRSAPEAASRRDREPTPNRDRALPMSESERHTLFEIGRFRTVAVQDMANHRYGGETSKMQRDLRSLQALGLVQRRTAILSRERGQLTVLVLTRAGRKVLEHGNLPPNQAVYAGFVKPAEVAHDAAIYRMFHKEAARIEGEGGTIRRIVLDYELKKKVYSPLAKVRHLPPLEYAKRQAQVAQENGLKVVAGKISAARSSDRIRNGGGRTHARGFAIGHASLPRFPSAHQSRSRIQDVCG